MPSFEDPFNSNLEECIENSSDFQFPKLLKLNRKFAKKRYCPFQHQMQTTDPAGGLSMKASLREEVGWWPSWL